MQIFSTDGCCSLDPKISWFEIKNESENWSIDKRCKVESGI